MKDALTEHASRYPAGARRGRVAFYDTLRGLIVVSMCAFHACYDLAYIYGLDMPWFTDPLIQDIWRDSISFTFIILAGWMTSYSRDNLKRAAVYALAALVVWGATTLAAVDTPVNFGILYCMAACTLVWACLERFLGSRVDELPGAALALICLAMLILFTLTDGVQRVRYPFEGRAWLGFPSTTFSSGDYYPLLPYLFLYLIGAFGAIRYHRAHASEPAWMLVDRCPLLTLIGRHSLAVYLLHQPMVLLALSIVIG